MKFRFRKLRFWSMFPLQRLGGEKILSREEANLIGESLRQNFRHFIPTQRTPDNPFDSTYHSNIPFFRRAKFGKIGINGRGRKLIVTLSCLAAFGVLFFQLSNGFREGGYGKQIPFLGGSTEETNRFGKSHHPRKKAPSVAELRANPESKALMAKAMEALDAEDHATVIDTGLEIRNRFGFPEGTDGATLASTFLYSPAYAAAMALAEEDKLPFASEWQTRFDRIPDPDSDSDPEACFLFGMVKMILAYQYMSKKDFETAQIVFASAKYYVSNEKSSLAKIPGVKDVLIKTSYLLCAHFFNLTTN